MQRKTADKFMSLQGHFFDGCSGAVILIRKANLSLTDVFNPVITDSNLMRITTQIFDHAFRAIEGTFGKHHPSMKGVRKDIMRRVFRVFS